MLSGFDKHRADAGTKRGRGISFAVANQGGLRQVDAESLAGVEE